MPSLSPNTVPPVLAVPLLNQEQDPMATDLRQIQRWSTWVPRTVFKATVGTQPPRFIEPLQMVGTYVGAATSGVLNIPITGYSYGYLPMVCSGDSGAGCTQVAVTLAGSTPTNLRVLCLTPNGVTITGNVRVNYILTGA